ncbi:hypothetical protein Tco_0708670 [Tanacetum coccineum]
MTTSVGNNSVFKSFFEKQKLTGPNFINWYKQLRLVLSTEDKEKYLEQPIPAAHVAAAPNQPIPHTAHATYNEWVKNQKEIVVMMLLTMDLEIQRNLAHLSANDMLIELKALYSKQAEQELLQTVREFHTCKQEEGQSLCENYNMHSMGKTVNELHAMLKLHEETLPKKFAPPALHAIRAGKGLRGSKKLNPRALSLYMGNGQRAAVEAIGNYHLASGSLENLEIIQEEDTNPSLDTSLNHEEDDQEIDEPQIDVEENELGDHDERANYKAALLDPESEKWLASMHVSMQSMKDNDVWELIELPPNAKIVGHKWLFKKKTDMDGANTHL